MNKTTIARLMLPAALAGAISAAVLGGAPVAAAQTTHHSGPNYSAITGARIGAPSEQEVSTYGGSHKHLWVEQELYGPGVVDVPRVDNTVHQSR
jgi:hypothetical protein